MFEFAKQEASTGQTDWGFIKFTNPDVSVWELVGQEGSSMTVVLCYEEGKEQSVVGGAGGWGLGVKEKKW